MTESLSVFVDEMTRVAREVEVMNWWNMEGLVG
jgi:hypothetical protein